MADVKTTVLLAIALTLLLGYTAISQTPPTAPSAGPKHHVAFQLSEGDDTAWGAVVIHVNNTMNALADDGGSEVEVVFWGPGLAMLAKTNTAYEARLKQLADRGVKLLACRNAMKNRKVKTEDLFPFTGQVDSGIAEVVKKQEAGWAYIH
jgi:intracellular sulfur oxidation DsrE/DsrF family protein